MSQAELLRHSPVNLGDFTMEIGNMVCKSMTKHKIVQTMMHQVETLQYNGAGQNFYETLHIGRENVQTFQNLEKKRNSSIQYVKSIIDFLPV